MTRPEQMLRPRVPCFSSSAGGQSLSPDPTLSFTLSAAWSTLSLTLETARSTLPSRLSFSSSVRLPAASFVRPFASSMCSPIFDRLLFRSPNGLPGEQRRKREMTDPTLTREDQPMSPVARERLSLDDAQILRLESAAIKGHTGKVLIVAADSTGRRLSVPALRERVTERMGDLPRLSERVVEPRLGLGRPAWAAADDIDLDWHVAEPAYAGALSDEELPPAVGDLLSERLDHTRPLWRLDTLPLTGGRMGIVFRIHPAMADGVSGMRLAAAILWDEESGSPSPAHESSSSRDPKPPPPPSPAPKPQPGEARVLVRLPAALWRELRPGAASSLDKHIGPGREVAWTTFPLERLKRIEHDAGEGVTVNDVVLAVVAGGLRRWIEGGSLPSHNLRVQCPVCLHAREEKKGELGNRDSFLNVDLPIAEDDPLERLRLINAETKERKLDHDADALYAFFHAIGR